MKIVIVDDQIGSLRDRLLYFLEQRESQYVVHREVDFPDLGIIAVPLFTDEKLIDDLKRQFSASVVSVWNERHLYHSRDAFIDRFVSALSLRDLIIWDYRMPEVSWIAGSHTASLEMLSEIRRQRPCHAVVVTLTTSIHPAAVLDFQRYFSTDEIMEGDDRETSGRLRCLVAELNTKPPQFVRTWSGITGRRFTARNIEDKEVHFRKRYATWFIDERTGIFEIRGRVVTTSLRTSRESYATFWDLVVNPDTEELKHPTPRLVQRIHAIRSWFSDPDEAASVIRSVRRLGYEIQPGISVLIVADDDVIAPEQRVVGGVPIQRV